MYHMNCGWFALELLIFALVDLHLHLKLNVPVNGHIIYHNHNTKHNSSLILGLKFIAHGTSPSACRCIITIDCKAVVNGVLKFFFKGFLVFSKFLNMLELDLESSLSLDPSVCYLDKLLDLKMFIN